jgi:hypothetical protein
MAILEATMREVRKRPFTFFSVQIQAKVTTSLKKGTDKVLQVDRKRHVVMTYWLLTSLGSFINQIFRGHHKSAKGTHKLLQVAIIRNRKSGCDTQKGTNKVQISYYKLR